MLINYKKIIETFNRDSLLCQLFQYEFSNGCNHILPSEINADIESLLVILNNYNKSHILYDKQFTFSLNLINSFYEPQCIVRNFCKNNKIQILNIDKMDKFLYGLDDGFIKVKK